MTNPTKKVKRKSARHYQMVTFSNALFDGVFFLPSLQQVPMGVMMGASSGDLKPMIKWLRDAKVDESQVDAFLEMSADELECFTNDWGEASAVDAKKSVN